MVLTMACELIEQSNPACFCLLLRMDRKTKDRKRRANEKRRQEGEWEEEGQLWLAHGRVYIERYAKQ